MRILEAINTCEHAIAYLYSLRREGYYCVEAIALLQAGRTLACYPPWHPGTAGYSKPHNGTEGW